jgi:hypothetical protein
MKKEAGTVDYFTDDVVMPAATGKGFKIGTWNETDAESPAFGWRDITGPIVVKGVGSKDPSWTQVGSGPFFCYAFGVADECWIPFHIPHDIVPGAPVHLHVHWFPSGTNTQPVKWQFTYTYAKGFNQGAYTAAGSTVTAESAGPGVAYQNMVTETDAITIAGLTEPDGILYLHLSRITNGGTNNTDTIFVTTADVHYQSTNMPTIGKAPGFYG